jgi:hypothetical protein
MDLVTTTIFVAFAGALFYGLLGFSFDGGGGKHNDLLEDVEVVTVSAETIGLDRHRNFDHGA